MLATAGNCACVLRALPPMDQIPASHPLHQPPHLINVVQMARSLCGKDSKAIGIDNSEKNDEHKKGFQAAVDAVDATAIRQERENGTLQFSLLM